MGQESKSDVLIVGAGIFGTSTAYHLSLTHPNPSRVTVLDRANVPSPEAASSDVNKIVRADYTNPFYMELAYEAMGEWESNPIIKPFWHRTGWVMLDEKSSDLADRIRRNFRQSGHPDTSKDTSLDEVKRAWGGVFSGIDTTDYDKAYTNSSAGWVDASSAVQATMEDALARGVRYEVGEATKLLHDGRKLVGVKTDDGKTHLAERIVLATGAWTPWLMASLEDELKMSEDLQVEKQIQAAGVCVAAFTLSVEEAAHYGQMPVLIYGAQGEVMPPTKDRLLKFTNANTFRNAQMHTSGRNISTPASRQEDVPAKLKAQSTEIIRRRIPQILANGRTPDYWRICYDAVSPDQSQLICQHPDPRLANLYLATAGSFHSWKFLPNIGKYVVKVLNGESNGKERDEVWSWKTSWSSRGAHEKVLPKGELQDFMQ